MGRGPAVAVILPSLNEEKYIHRALDSLHNQSFKQYRLILADSGSTDETVQIAESYGAYILQVPKGKLTARHLAIRACREEIIVSVDADTTYPVNWLQTTIDAFKVPGVVAVTGPRLFDFVFKDAMQEYYELAWRMFGSNSAFWREAYFWTGGFDLTINQQDAAAMVREEETKFRDRLMAFGIVLYQSQNPVYTSARRYTKSDATYEAERAKSLRF